MSAAQRCGTCALALAGLLAPGGCAGPPVPPLSADDFTLRGVPVETDSAELRLTFGEPDSITVSENPFSSDAPLSSWHYEGFEIRFGGARTPVGYLIELPGERTARGVAVGDPVEVALQLYGTPDAEYPPNWTWIDEADSAALRVIDVVVLADTVRRIYIGRALR